MVYLKIDNYMETIDAFIENFVFDLRFYVTVFGATLTAFFAFYPDFKELIERNSAYLYKNFNGFRNSLFLTYIILIIIQLNIGNQDKVNAEKQSNELLGQLENIDKTNKKLRSDIKSLRESLEPFRLMAINQYPFETDKEALKKFTINVEDFVEKERLRIEHEAQAEELRHFVITLENHPDIDNIFNTIVKELIGQLNKNIDEYIVYSDEELFDDDNLENFRDKINYNLFLEDIKDYNEAILPNSKPLIGIIKNCFFENIAKIQLEIIPALKEELKWDDEQLILRSKIIASSNNTLVIIMNIVNSRNISVAKVTKSIPYPTSYY